MSDCASPSCILRTSAAKRVWRNTRCLYVWCTRERPIRGSSKMFTNNSTHTHTHTYTHTHKIKNGHFKIEWLERERERERERKKKEKISNSKIVKNRIGCSLWNVHNALLSALPFDVQATLHLTPSITSEVFSHEGVVLLLGSDTGVARRSILVIVYSVFWALLLSSISLSLSLSLYIYIYNISRALRVVCTSHAIFCIK